MRAATGVFADAPSARLVEADRAVGGILSGLFLEKAAETEIEHFQRLYTQAVRKVFTAQYDAFEQIDIRANLEELLGEAERILGKDLAGKLAPETERYLKQAFVTGKALRGIPQSVASSFAPTHGRAVEWLVDHDRFWIGKVFPEHMREGFRDTIVRGLDEGLGRKDIGRQLRGLSFGTEEVPGKLELYNRVASSSVNRARNWGGMFSLEEAEFDEYVFRAVMDQRTSRICREMNGRVFSVPKVMDKVREALDGLPSAIESVAPWPTFDRERGDFFIRRAGGREYLSGRSRDWLEASGVALPPLHGNCRSVIVPRR
jgi:hypothetical protein